MLRLSLQAMYLLLPAYLANMAPVIVMKWGVLKQLAVPIDRGRKLSDGKELFGSHKTWRGFLVAVLAGMLMALIQRALLGVPFFSGLSVLPYDHALLIGFLMGLGAILGDLAKSFLKRRMGIDPGKPWIPFDQIDFVLGAYGLLALFYLVPWKLFWVSLLLSFILHVLTNHLSFWLGVRRERW